MKLPPSTVFVLLTAKLFNVMYDVHTKTVPSNLDNFVKTRKKNITIISDYQQIKVSLSDTPELKSIEKIVSH